MIASLVFLDLCAPVSTCLIFFHALEGMCHKSLHTRCRVGFLGWHFGSKLGIRVFHRNLVPLFADPLSPRRLVIRFLLRLDFLGCRVELSSGSSASLFDVLPRARNICDSSVVEIWATQFFCQMLSTIVLSWIMTWQRQYRGHLFVIILA